MSSSHICLTCRRELYRLQLRRAPLQWTPKAHFISLAAIVPPKKEAEGEEGDHTQNRPNRRIVSNSRVSEGEQNHADKDELRPASGRYSKGPPTNSRLHKENLKNLHASFSRSLASLLPTEASQVDLRQQSSSSYEQSAERPTSLKGNTPAVQLWNMLDKTPQDVAEIWTFAEQHYFGSQKNVAISSTEDEALIKKHGLFRRVLRAICTRWEPKNTTLPAPEDLIARLASRGLMYQGWYLREILELLYRMIRLEHNREFEGKQDVRHIQVELEYQILSIWSQFLRNCGSGVAVRSSRPHDPSEVGGVHWQGTPDPETLNFSKSTGADAYKFSFRMYRLFRNLPAGSTSHLAAAAALTYIYFASKYCRIDVQAEKSIAYKPFLQLMMKTLHGAKGLEIVTSLCETLLEDQNIDTDVIAQYSQNLQRAQQRVVLAYGAQDIQLLGQEKINLTDTQESKLVSHLFSRVKRQVETKNRGMLDQLWEQSVLIYGSSDDGEASQSLIPSKLYTAFLFGYRELEDPQRQIEVWNHMLQAGIDPTIDQWGLMISARMMHLQSLEDLWSRMVAAGVKPDFQTWCVRVSAHIYHGHPEEGIQMLYRWGSSWYDEVRDIFKKQGVNMPNVGQLTRDGPTVPRPTTDALTTAVTALVQRRGGKGKRLDLVPDAFAWAKSLAIQPNLWTYNILFRTCLKDGNLQEGMQILARMEEDGITPDAYTFHAFAEFVFKSSSRQEMDDDEQYNLIYSVLDMLEQRGLEPNTVFFGMMIGSLLSSKKGRPNPEAALMLVRIMLDKEVVVSSTIWTSFMSFYFQQDVRGDGTNSPDLEAVESLWRQMSQMQPLVLDSIFYDRMVEGFSKAGNVARAKVFFDRMVAEGKRPGWPALEALLRAYVSAGLADQARGLVADVTAGIGPMNGGIRNRSSNGLSLRDRFFRAAKEAGVLDNATDAITKFEQQARSDTSATQIPESTSQREQEAEDHSIEDMQDVLARPGVTLTKPWREVVGDL